MTTQPQRYEVQILIGGNWENVSHDDTGAPLTFATREEADQDLAEHLQGMRDANMDHDPEDYRVVPCVPLSPDALPRVDKRPNSIYARTMDALQAADEIGGCASAADYVALMSAIISECQVRLETARHNARARTETQDPDALLAQVLEMLYDAQGAILRFQVPDNLADAFDLFHSNGDIHFDYETDCYLHPDALPLPDGSAGYYIPHQFQR